MDTQELEQRLEAGRETQSFDVKAPMPWSAAKLAKHILALANVRDGGYIVIGVMDNTFERKGVGAADLATYKLDTMRDHMSKYADPHVDFSVSFPTDLDGLQFVAIRVEPFQAIPVICRTSKDGLQQGAIYYRNTNMRPQSAPISNSYDMRDVVTLAAVRMGRQFEDLGLQLQETASGDRRFDDELGGL